GPDPRPAGEVQADDRRVLQVAQPDPRVLQQVTRGRAANQPAVGGRDLRPPPRCVHKVAGRLRVPSPNEPRYTECAGYFSARPRHVTPLTGPPPCVTPAGVCSSSLSDSSPRPPGPTS